MAKPHSTFSDLEREFERQMQDAPVEAVELELEGDFELPSDQEFDEDSERQYEQDDDSETTFEMLYDDGSRSNEFVERLLEISGREFESSAEVHEAMNEVLDDIEREYFWKSIKRGLKDIRKSNVLRKLAKSGLKLGVSQFAPALQGALQLARGNVTGAVRTLAPSAAKFIPGGAVMLDAVKSIGLGTGDEPARERETWENYVTLAREAYEHLAENLNERADQPAEATRLANNAVQHAIRQAQARTARAHKARGSSSSDSSRVVRLRVAPGERIKLIITGG